MTTLRAQLAVLAGLFALAILLQYVNGAFHCEFGSYPDEPAHYVTSLMVREYIAGPHPLSPLKFAEDYYQHYPKVAFGHWPPVFYFVQGLWMLIFSASRISVRLEVAFTTAVLGWILWREASKWFGNVAASVAAALLVCLPIVQSSTDEEMAEMLLTLFCFVATIYFGRFLEFFKRSDALWFGFYFSLAVLTKGSGWLLAFIPPIGILLTRRFRVLRDPSLWLGLCLTAILCLPWQIATLHSAERGWTGGSKPSVGYTFYALGRFFTMLAPIAGSLLLGLMLLGIVVTVVRCALKGPVGAVPAVLVALFLGDWFFHSLVPAGVEDRKLIIAVPALIYFLFAGGFWLADRIPPNGIALRWRRALVAAAGVVAFAIQAFCIPRADFYGYSSAAGFITSAPALRGDTMLVSSDIGGEGLLISEVAMRQPRPQHVILRATKELAEVDWSGEHYESRFSTPEELFAYLQKRHIDLLVTDDYRTVKPFAHHLLLNQVMQRNPSRFQVLATFQGKAAGGPGIVKVITLLPREQH